MLGHNDTRHDTLHSLFTALYHEIQEHKRQKEAATAALLAEQSHFQLVDTDTEETADYIPLACTDEEEEEQGITCISDDEQKSIIFIDSDDEVEVIEPTQPVVKKRRTIKSAQSSVPKCSLCFVDLTTSHVYRQRPLDSKCFFRQRIYCLGCARLLAFPQTEMEKREMISYLITGKIPRHDQPPSLDRVQVFKRLCSRFDQIRNRHQMKAGSDVEFRLRRDELIHTYINENQTCQVSGMRCYLHDARYDRVPYWALTFDHIVPVSKRFRDPKLWATENLQTMSSVLNAVKSDATDAELTRWYQRFLEAHLVVLD